MIVDYERKHNLSEVVIKMMYSAFAANAENPLEHMANYCLELTGSSLKEYRQAERDVFENAFCTEQLEGVQEEIAGRVEAVRLPSAVTEVSTSSLVDLRAEITERTLNNINADDIFKPCEEAVEMDLITFSSSTIKEEQSDFSSL